MFQIKKYGALLLSAGLLTLAGCKKEPDNKPVDNQVPSSISDLKVSDNFKFASTQDIKLNVKIENAAFAGEVLRVNVYDGFPTVGALVTSAIVRDGESKSLDFRLPSASSNFYVEKISANGAKELKKVETRDYVSLNFERQTPILKLKNSGSGLNCSSGCGTVYNNYNGNLNINSGDVICLTGTYSGNVNMNGGTLRVCGTANLSITMNNSGATVYFLENSIITANSVNQNAAGTQIFNYSDSLRFTSSFSAGGSVVNNGKMSVNGDFNINNNSTNTFTNNGELFVNASMNNNRRVENNNSIVVQGTYAANGGSQNVNNCKLIINNNFQQNTSFTNNSYIKVANTTFLNGGSTLTMHNGSQLSTKDIQYNGNVSGTGSNQSTIKVTNSTTINGGAGMTGNVNYCDLNGIETNNSNINSSFFTCSGNYIATSACNPEGFGTPTIVDTDNDGVPDSQDDYPNDPTRAFNSYYPSAAGWSTLGFEDLWPGKGDYDFNDMVISYRIKIVSNASNNVVEVSAKTVVRAIGASFDNGFGVQFDDLVPNDIETITGQVLTKSLVTLNANKTESGQDKAVVMFFDSPEPLITRAGGSFFNTIKNGPVGTFDTAEVYIKFTTPQAPSKLTLNKWNPFIFVNGVRGREVHLIDRVPTNKADVNLFGTSQDASVPALNRYYKTASNLPWAIEIPIWFEYPSEKDPISSAYLKFNSWAFSNGVSYPNWYANNPGFRNTNFIW